MIWEKKIRGPCDVSIFHLITLIEAADLGSLLKGSINNAVDKTGFPDGKGTTHNNLYDRIVILVGTEYCP